MSRKRSFAVAPPAIVNPGFLASASDPLLVYTILNGRPGTIMPSFAKLGLTDQDAADLIAYMRDQGMQADKRAADDAEVVEKGPDALTHVLESSYDLKTTVENIKRSLKGYNFRSFPDRKLQQGLTDIQQVDARQVALRFCNFNRLYDLLRVEPRLGVVLPCRITVIEGDDGQVRLYAPNMRTVASWFNNRELSNFFVEMDDSLMEILDEATL
jgi:cytochrome c oxidase cbb3-type subunit 3